MLHNPSAPHLSCRSVNQQKTGSNAGSSTSRAAQEVLDSSHMRLGLRVEQRGSLRKLVRLMQQRLEVASSDLQVCLFLCFEPCFGYLDYVHKLSQDLLQL